MPVNHGATVSQYIEDYNQQHQNKEQLEFLWKKLLLGNSRYDANACCDQFYWSPSENEHI